MQMYFFDMNNIKKLFINFTKINIDTMINSYNNSKDIDYDYIVTVEK